MIFIIAAITCISISVQAQKNVLEKRVDTTIYLKQLPFQSKKNIVNTIPNAIAINDLKFGIDYTANNKKGFDINIGRLDNMPVLTPDAKNRLLLKIRFPAEEGLIRGYFSGHTFATNKPLPTYQQLDSLNKALH